MAILAELRLADLDEVDPVLMTAFGSPRSYKPKLRRLLELGPGDWLQAREGGRAVGTGGFTVMGRVAYVGCMAVLPDFQGRGIARSILERLLAMAAARGCATILLDASEKGRPLYEKLGFRTEDSVARWRRGPRAAEAPFPAGGGGSRVITLAEEERRLAGGGEAGLEEAAAFDRAAWGADRARILASFARDDPFRFAVSRGPDGRLTGYAILQSEEGVLGPWLASSPEAARGLLAWALGQGGEAPDTAYLPDANAAGAALLLEAGFDLELRQTHMRLGPPIPAARRLLVYSQASFSLG